MKNNNITFTLRFDDTSKNKVLSKMKSCKNYIYGEKINNDIKKNIKSDSISKVIDTLDMIAIKLIDALEGADDPYSDELIPINEMLDYCQEDEALCTINGYLINELLSTINPLFKLDMLSYNKMILDIYKSVS